MKNFECFACKKKFNGYGNRLYCCKKCSANCPIRKEKQRVLVKGRRHSPATEFKKGGHYSPHTEFKKGMKSWNKGAKNPNITGDKHPMWKGGRRISKDGYIMIHAPSHPFAKKGSYVCEHRLIAEKILNRFLTPEEVIHHINEVKTDNHPENLYLFSSNSEHLRHHWDLKDGKTGILCSNII